jgi:hypothetical protein
MGFFIHRFIDHPRIGCEHYCASSSGGASRFSLAEQLSASLKLQFFSLNDFEARRRFNFL